MCNKGEEVKHHYVDACKLLWLFTFDTIIRMHIFHTHAHTIAVEIIFLHTVRINIIIFLQQNYLQKLYVFATNFIISGGRKW